MTEIVEVWRLVGEGTAVRVRHLQDGHRCEVRFIWMMVVEVSQHLLLNIRESFDATRHFVRFGARVV